MGFVDAFVYAAFRLQLHWIFAGMLINKAKGIEVIWHLP